MSQSTESRNKAIVLDTPEHTAHHVAPSPSSRCNCAVHGEEHDYGERYRHQ
jgi:hypothetical protein